MATTSTKFSGASHLLLGYSVLLLGGFFLTFTQSHPVHDESSVFLTSASVEVTKAVNERQVFKVGNAVVPGVEWRDGDKQAIGIGRVNAAFNDGWVQVKWANGKTDLHWGSGHQLRVVNDATDKTPQDLQSGSCERAPSGATTSAKESNLQIGAKVVRGPNWNWGDQDGGAGCVGKIVDIGLDKWVKVRWISSLEPEAKAFRFNLDRVYDILVLLPEPQLHKSKRSESDVPDPRLPQESIDDNQIDGTGVKVQKPEEQEKLTTAQLEVMAKKVRSGSLVQRSRDWIWSNQDGSPPGIGEVVKVRPDKWVRVKWLKTNEKNNYRLGYKNKFDVELTDHQPSPPTPRPKHPFNSTDPEELMIGDQVVRGPNWSWNEQDGGAGQIGTVMSEKNSNGWIRVRWTATGIQNMYRLKPGKVDIRLADFTNTNSTPRVPPAPSTLVPSTTATPIPVTENASQQFPVEHVRSSSVPAPITAPASVSTTTATPPVQTEIDILPPPIHVGDKVKRGQDWIWEDQDGKDTGIVTRKINETYWVLVKWKSGTIHAYRYSREPYGPRDLEVVPTDIHLQHHLDEIV